MAFSENEVNFNKVTAQFSQLMYGRTENDTNHISKLLDDINFLDYRYPVVTNPTKAVLLVHQCCTLVPPDNPKLVSKCCQLITNLINRQHVQIEGHTLILAVHWCLQAVQLKESSVEVLVVLEALLRSNVANLKQLLGIVIGNSSPILSLTQDETYPEVCLSAIQCLEACTIVPEGEKSKDKNGNFNTQLEIVAHNFLKYLLRDKVGNFNDLLHSKLLISCIRGLQNIVVHNPSFLTKELGILLGVSKTYMVFGINGISFVVPQKVMPSVLNIPEPSGMAKEKKGGKMTKQRKPRAPSNREANKSETLEEIIMESKLGSYVPATNLEMETSISSILHSGSWLKTSDSDFSDSESGRVAKIGITQAKVRQAALNLLILIIKLVDKHLIFSYWSSLVPDGPSSGVHNLAMCILRDPSPKGRMAALNALLILLTKSKLYLSLAEFSGKFTAYTPFSVILGATLIELHKRLILALNENSVLVLTQVVKCLAALVQATPYHRLTPGLLTKVIRNMKIYTSHKDTTVQVVTLIVLGCILASEPTLPETKEALLRRIMPPKSEEKPKPENSEKKAKESEKEVEFVDFSSDEEAVPNNNEDPPWLLQKCLDNLNIADENKMVPTPVKLESLQILSAMARNYFNSLIAPYLTNVTEAVNVSLVDKSVEVCLHAGRSVDFVGQAMNQYLTASTNSESGKGAILEQSFTFWQTLLNTALPTLLQDDQNAVLRAVGCDCLGSIGPLVFDRFSRDKQILVITLLFGSTRDEEPSVRAAAIRAVAICVSYPTLREDAGFVVDVAEAVYRAVQDEQMMVRMKASWSLGNLSEALVLNKSNSDAEELPDSLLLRLLDVSVKSTAENDKIKMNAVRALGNLLQLINGDLMEQKPFMQSVERAVQALVRTATSGTNMKVRWNSCYAIGNALKNSCLYAKTEHQKSLIDALMDLVVSCRNFKVRINAALALASPNSRVFYGAFFSSVWTALINALENTQNVEDFSEYNHWDHLVEQICLTLGHMTTLLEKEDLSHIHSITTLHLDLFKMQMHRVSERVVPEKATALLTAVSRLRDLKNGDLAEEESRTVEALINVFINAIFE